MSPTSYQAAPPRIIEAKLRRRSRGCQVCCERAEGTCQRFVSARHGSLSARNHWSMRGQRLRGRHATDILPRLDRGTVTSVRQPCIPWRKSLTRNRFAFASLAALLALASGTRPAGAAAEVHRLILVVSGIPTQISGGDVND